MKDFYNKLKIVLEKEGEFVIADYAENCIETFDKLLILAVGEIRPIEPSFCQYEADFTATFINCDDWADCAVRLSNALTTLIPMEDRADEQSKKLNDNTEILTLLDTPQFTELDSSIDPENGEETYTVNVTVNFQF